MKKQSTLFLSLLAVALVAAPLGAVAQRHHHHHNRSANSPLKALDYTTDVNQYGQTVGVIPLSAESQDGFLVFQNKQADYRIWFDIRVQTDGALFWGATEGADKIGNGVSIRRARFAVKGQFRKDWYGELDMDLADGVEATVNAAVMRFKPIVMTSLTFVLGMLPLVFATGPGADSRQGIGVGVFFGMLIAMTIGIVLVPFFFVWIYKIKEKIKARRSR